jgi:hypothetical protein
MALSIDSWNINPNRAWFVRLSDGGSGISVELYLGQTDAQAQTSRQTHGITAGYGAELDVTLSNDPGAAFPVSFFQDYPWHLRVSGASGDTAKVFKVKEFVDLDEIDHPIFRNAVLIPVRAAAEIDAHTHALIRKEIALGSHLPELEPGGIVRLSSSRRGRVENLQAVEHRIVGEQSEGGETHLTSTIAATSHMALRR